MESDIVWGCWQSVADVDIDRNFSLSGRRGRHRRSLLTFFRLFLKIDYSFLEFTTERFARPTSVEEKVCVSVLL